MTTAKAAATPYPAFSVEFRANDNPSAPKLTITGSNASELQDRVDAALSNSLFAVVGNASEQLTASYNLGNLLGAKPVDAPQPEASAAGPSFQDIFDAASGAAAPKTEAASQALAARKEAAAPETPEAAPAEAPWGSEEAAAAVWPPVPDPAPEPAAPPAAAPAASGGASGGWPPAPAWAS